MNKPIDFQTINGADGQPMFVVVPYAVFVERFEQVGDLVPHEVASLVFEQDMTPARAWRTHLQLTQQEAASRIGASQSAYAQSEASTKLRKASREKIAKALGIRAAQLEF